MLLVPSWLPVVLAAMVLLGAGLVAVLDYRVLLVAMAVVTLAAAAYLMGGSRSPQAAPAPAAAPVPDLD